MKRKQLVFFLLICLLASVRGFSQTTLVCNDLVSITLDPDCSHTIGHAEILEGQFCLPCDYEVTIDKVLPYGNGPWVAAIVGVDDLGKTYVVRVRDTAFTGNACWGNVSIALQLECNGVTTVNLDSGLPTILTPAGLEIDFAGECSVIEAASSTMANGQSSVTYDCDDLGVHILQVTASDQSSNTATCFTTVVVDDPSSECSTCITCPPAASTTFIESASTLIPAFQANNWSAFDAFGDAAYSGTCSFEDSTYTIEYHTSPHGQNWFVRRWEGKGAGGQVIGACHQVVTFPFLQDIAISGTVFFDSIPDCQLNAGEKGTNLFNIVATVLPSNKQTYVPLNTDGSYSFNVTVNGLDSVVVVQYLLPGGVHSTCPTTFLVPAATTVQQHTFDIGLRAEGTCPRMQVNINASLMRRCFDNVLFIQYCNLGLVPAADAYINVKLDDLLQLTSASLPWTPLGGNVFTIALGDVPPLFCGTLNVYANLSCDAELGQTICSNATIFPHGPCEGPAWSGPYVETTAYCNGDTVFLAVWNTGAEQMTAPRNFIVIEDVIMYMQGNFQLDAGDSITVKMPANGATWRIEAEQVPDYPFRDEPSAAIEGCNGLNTPGLINAFPPNDGRLFYSSYCAVVRGSFDPNDKAAVPTGYGAFNTIRANTDLEYKIRFQNTGTDTAFRVVIVDTLTQLLDPATLEPGVSSHPYRLDVFPGGILHFVFDPIFLPDSNVNEVGSHGFVTFRIAQQPDLPDGTVIANTASIYFDFNEPVVTNTVWHTIGAPFIAVHVDDPVVPGVSVSVRPNPFHDRTVITLQGVEMDQGLLTLFDGQGRAVHTQVFQGNQCTLDRRNLNQGLYFFQISAEGKSVARGKLQAY